MDSSRASKIARRSERAFCRFIEFNEFFSRGTTTKKEKQKKKIHESRKAITSKLDVKARQIGERRIAERRVTVRAQRWSQPAVRRSRHASGVSPQLQSMARVYIKRCMSMFVPPFVRSFARSLARSLYALWSLTLWKPHAFSYIQIASTHQ